MVYDVVQDILNFGFSIIPPTVFMAVLPFAACIVIVKVVKSL